MDSNFTGVSPECLPAQTVQVKFVRILALASCIVTKFDFAGSLHAFGVILCLRHKSKLLEPGFGTDAVWLRRCGPSTTEQEAVDAADKAAKLVG
jgi:hypothetical protein